MHWLAQQDLYSIHKSVSCLITLFILLSSDNLSWIKCVQNTSILVRGSLWKFSILFQSLPFRCVRGQPWHVSQQTRQIYPMLDQCWTTVYDVGPTLVKHWVDLSCFLSIDHHWAAILIKNITTLVYYTGLAINKITSKQIICTNLSSKLVQRLRRWPDIQLSFVDRIMSAVMRTYIEQRPFQEIIHFILWYNLLLDSIFKVIERVHGLFYSMLRINTDINLHCHP